MSQLRSVIEEREDVVSVELGGDLDVASAQAFERALVKAAEASQSTLLLDLRKLEFIDSVGLHAVIVASERAKRAGQRFVIVRGPAAVQRVFTMTMLDQRFEFVDDHTAL